MNDNELMRRVAEGDRYAFERLYERYKRPVMSFVWHMVGDYQLAQDIVQESFLRIIKHARRFDPEKKFSTWLFSIAANRSRDELRKRRRRGRLLNVEYGEAALPVHSLQEWPRKSASERERGELLHREIRRLDVSHREIILLHYLNSLTYREIAQITGCPMGTVQSRMHAALRTLRRRLGKILG